MTQTFTTVVVRVDFENLAVAIDQKHQNIVAEKQLMASTSDSGVKFIEPSLSGTSSESSRTPTPTPDEQKLETNAGSTNGIIPQRRYHKKKWGEDGPVRKSNRINKTPESDANLVENYTQIELKRNNIVPTGPIRKDFKFPVVLKATPEQERLKIEMKAPVAKSSCMIGTSALKMNGEVRKFNPNGVAVLPDYQGEMSLDDRENLEDREELITISLDMLNKDINKEFEEASKVISEQFEGTIPIDATLRRFNHCRFDVNRLLETIEMERDNLPQPFRPLTVAQQIEFEKFMNDYFFFRRDFGVMQEKFLRQHHLGEIITYYFTTKRRTCGVQRTRCACKERRRSENFVERVECENCTKNIRPNAIGTNKFCGVCSLYFKRNGKQRTSPGRWTNFELDVLNDWKELEKETGSVLKLAEVQEKMEQKRVEEIMNRNLTLDEASMLPYAIRKKDKPTVIQMLKKYVPGYLPTCRNCKKEKMGEIQSPIKADKVVEVKMDTSETIIEETMDTDGKIIEAPVEQTTPTTTAITTETTQSSISPKTRKRMVLPSTRVTRSAIKRKLNITEPQKPWMPRSYRRKSVI